MHKTGCIQFHRCIQPVFYFIDSYIFVYFMQQAYYLIPRNAPRFPLLPCEAL